MFRFKYEPSSGGRKQCLAKITRMVLMCWSFYWRFGVMAAYADLYPTHYADGCYHFLFYLNSCFYFFTLPQTCLNTVFLFHSSLLSFLPFLSFVLHLLGIQSPPFRQLLRIVAYLTTMNQLITLGGTGYHYKDM